MTTMRSWKMSRGGGALFVASGCALLLGGLVWTISLRPIVMEGWWRSAQSWHQASFALAALFSFYAAWGFNTGSTATRFGSQPMPRDYGFNWLIMAEFPFTLGVLAHLPRKR